ncbi:MFS transporter [Pimelobacter simplex]|uniref:ABC transporter, permease protein n=1 Tax=Nocardioides simplex TaxID=2045 RepID=A0A0A1DRG0_NOCSI|nr:MFS transporter [Pimelobacter simplex]AIY19143.1 ABC transporter, permease protein [Pimelobacter simplex]MCG8149175.1 MFS transporter [Pimelobacter simplex]GEB14974.1 MFS transporter [Pimelobacter simplex]SFM22527.1 Major Facilitator Superfamily protein [Pimelobacter simplex]
MPAHAPSLVRATGASYFPIALVARLPYAMMVVGVLTLVVAGRDSLAFGGLNSAVVGLGAACVGPLLGAAADRFGQRRVLLASGVASATALALMAWVVYSPLPGAAVLAVAFLVGASAPQIAPMSRSRLVQIIGSKIAPGRRSRTFDATMAYESAADEIVFIIGPFVVGLLGTTLDPWAPVAGAAVLTLVFVSAFALHPSAAVAERHGEQALPAAPARELTRPALLAVVAGIFGVGLFFGAMLTSLTSFMGDHGSAASAGLVYGVMGIGSATLALSVALFPKAFSLRARWLVFGATMLAGALLLPLASSVLQMCLVLLVIGCGIGPTMVTQYSLGAHRSPAGRSATVMTILGSAVIVGQSAASAVTGNLADRFGTDAALVMPIVAAAVVVLAGAANWVLSPAPAGGQSPSTTMVTPPLANAGTSA